MIDDDGDPLTYATRYAIAYHRARAECLRDLAREFWGWDRFDSSRYIEHVEMTVRMHDTRAAQLADNLTTRDFAAEYEAAKGQPL